MKESPGTSSPIVPAENLRLRIDDDTFHAWFRGISQDEAEGFRYAGGDQHLLKFVCAYQYEIANEAPHMTAITRAYAATYGLDPAAYTCRARGVEAYRHPAVRYLFDCFAARSLAQVKNNMLGKYERLLNRVLDQGLDGEGKESIAALAEGTRFLKMMMDDGNARRRAALKNPKPVKGETYDAATTVDRSADAPDDRPADE